MASVSGGNRLLTNHDIGITRHISFITTAIDIAYNVGTQNGLRLTHRINASIFIITNVMLNRRGRTDIHRSISMNFCFITTAKDTTFDMGTILIISTSNLA